ncbi:MAG: cystathionine gamma-synthase [Thermoleophilia bacterium]|nr:cystathionine gamma-synthase [Thermoleophilia bacterium]
MGEPTDHGHPRRRRASEYEGQAFGTRAIHAGQDPDPATGAVIAPVYLNSTYVQHGVGDFAGYDYSRTDNPTRRALEIQLAALEDGDHGIAFASGMAATSTVLQTLSPGDHVLCINDTYGGTYRLFTKVLERHAGLDFTFVEMRDMDAIAAAMTDRTRLVWVETPTNPLLNVVDIEAIASVAHARRARLAVDNTFATPFLQQPLTLGADIVAHSMTKYLGGHSDVVGGALVTNDDQLAEELRFLQNAVGAIPGPMDSWLVTRGLKTLHVRMERHCENALAIATMLESRSDVDQVLYPGLESHPDHPIVQRQMRAGGGMVSFRAAGGQERAKALCAATGLFTLAESLGGVESLIELPGLMTHQSVAGSPLEVPAELVRISVGIEHVDDLLRDLEQALDATANLVSAAGSGANAR